jgi:class 3 adenylate cyclase/tetratricopeptide (TPR) repeat protein
VAGERIAQRVELLLADARAALEAGDPAEARALARAVLALDPANPSAESLLEGFDQRIQVTLMFCDLVGSTPLADGCDPEEMSAILREYRLLCTAAIGRYGGFVEDRKGDGLLIRFGYPWVHEDDARRAVLSGLDIVSAIQAHPRGLHVRIAVHTGLVVLDGEEVVGATPNEAARLQGLAPPDTVVISDATHDLVRGYFDVRPQGLATLRGVSRPIEIFAVLGERASEHLEVADGVTLFTGRRAELAIVRELWERACRERDSAVAAPPAALLISGPAGIGKSRLAREGAVVLDAGCLTSGCSSYHATTSLHPFVGLLETICAITPQDDVRQRLAKLRARLARYVGGTGGDLPVLTAALSIPAAETSPTTDVDPTKLRTLALLAAADLLSSAAADGPVMLLIDDLHWADESSLELIGVLLAAPCPGMLVLMTARPDFVSPWPQELVRRLVLEPLPPDDLQRMTRRIADAAGLDEDQRHELIARSDGIPLYLEELVRSGSALHTHPGASSALRAAASRIPAALRDPLLARLVLPGVDLALVQTAATIGRDVAGTLLQRACGLSDKPFQSKLANLVAAGLVDAPGDGSIRFRHDLLRDAAYETQRHTVRRQRHGRIADLLRDRPSGRGGDAGTLAFHLERAERLAEAIEALFAAAGADQALGAHQEAMTKLTRILALVEGLPAGAPRLLGELSARQLRSFSATMIGGYSAPETAQDQARCVELCEHLALTPELMPSLIVSWSYYAFRGDLREAMRVCATIQRLTSERELPAEAIALARSILGVQCFFRGAFGEAGRIMGDFLRHPSWQSDEAPERGWPLPHDPVAGVSAHLVVTMAMRGEVEQAIELADRAVRRAERLRFPFGPFSVAYVKSQLAVLHTIEGSYEDAARLGAEVAELGERHGFVLWSLCGTMGLLCARAQLGDAGVLDQLALLVDQFRTLLSAELWVPYWMTEQGSAQLAAGREADARTSFDDALRVASLTGADYYTSQILRVRGALRCESGDAGGLEDLRAAIDKARVQGATALELRAVHALKLQGAQQLATS